MGDGRVGRGVGSGVGVTVGGRVNELGNNVGKLDGLKAVDTVGSFEGPPDGKVVGIIVIGVGS